MSPSPQGSNNDLEPTPINEQFMALPNVSVPGNGNGGSNSSNNNGINVNLGNLNGDAVISSASNGVKHEGRPEKTKMHSVMEAANALTALCDEDEEEGNNTNNGSSDDNSNNSPQDTAPKPDSSNSNANGNGETSSSNNGSPAPESLPKPTKRFIPEHKKPDAALTFPEKLMSLMKFADDQEDKRNYCISWLDDGKSFVIRDPDGFTRQVLPKFFKATKFSSFTRKLYRWGFRQVNRGIGPDDPIIFGNEYFQRDDPEQMKKMRSVTAASTRKTEQANLLLQQQQQLQQQQFTLNMMGMNKRPFDATGAIAGNDPKRILLEQWMQQKAMTQQNMYNPNPAGQGMNLTSALGRNPHFNPASLNTGGMKPFEMMGFNNGNQGGQMAPSNPLFGSFQMQSLAQQQNDNQQQQHHHQQQQHLFQQQQQQQQQQQHFQQQHQQQQQQKQQQQQGSGYPATASTADIVNAAINALKYAS